MHDNKHGERDGGVVLVDTPQRRHDAGEADHEDDDGEAEEKGASKFAEELLPLLDEGCRLVDLLGRCAPGHVDAEHVAQQCLAHMQGDATKKDREQWKPLVVCNHYQT